MPAWFDSETGMASEASQVGHPLRAHDLARLLLDSSMPLQRIGRGPYFPSGNECSALVP